MASAPPVSHVFSPVAVTGQALGIHFSYHHNLTPRGLSPKWEDTAFEEKQVSMRRADLLIVVGDFLRQIANWEKTRRGCTGSLEFLTPQKCWELQIPIQETMVKSAFCVAVERPWVRWLGGIHSKQCHYGHTCPSVCHLS